MAIYWVDPYIGTVAGGLTGVNGTTSATIRNGSFESPLRFSDIFSTSSSIAPGYNAIVFAAADEIRIKGLTDAQWKIALGDSWALASATETYSPSFVTTTKSTTAPVPAAYLGTAPTKMPLMWVDSCPGFGGEYAIFAARYVTESTTGYTVYGGEYDGAGQSFPIMGVAGFTASMVNYDYAITVPTGYIYMFQNLGVALTITDGWTDAVTRGGKTWFIFASTGMVYCYLGNNSAGNGGAAYTIDLKNSHFSFPTFNTWGLEFWLYAAVNQTVTVGSITRSYGNWTAMLSMYYSAGCNLSVSTSIGTTYPLFKYIWSGVPTNAIITTRNVSSGYYAGIWGSVGVGETHKIRCIGGGMGSYQGLPTVTGMTIEFLVGSIIRPLHYVYGALFYGTMPTVTGVVPARTYAGVINLQAGALNTPAFALLQSMTSDANIIYSGVLPIDSDKFTTSLALQFQTSYTFDDVYRWDRLTDARDYRTLNSKVITSSTVSGETARSIHFASNSFDARPVALIFSASGKALFMYNEAAQGNALTFQSATAALGENYYKRLPLSLPAYGATVTGVRLDFDYITSADFTSGEMGISLVGISGPTGVEMIEPLLGGAGELVLAGAQTLVTTATYMIPKSWLTTSAITQLQVKLRFKSGAGVGKFYVRAINLTAV